MGEPGRGAARRLLVDIGGARGLLPKAGHGAADPFAIVRDNRRTLRPVSPVDFYGQQHKTSVKLGELNPTWNEAFTFTLPDDGGEQQPGEAEQLEINVFSRVREGRSRDKFLGRVRLPVVGAHCQGQLRRLPLEKRGIFSHIKGELLLKLSIVEIQPEKLDTLQEESIGVSPELLAKSPGKQLQPGLLRRLTSSEAPTPKGSGSYDLVQEVRYVFVQVLSARSLIAKDFSGTSDPFARVSVGNQSSRTKTIYKELNPEWSETFAFAASQSEGFDINTGFVEVSIWDEDKLFQNDFLGEVRVPLADLPKRDTGDPPALVQWYKLSAQSARAKVKGDVQLCMWTGSQADESFKKAWQSDLGGSRHSRATVYVSPKLWYVRCVVMEVQDLLLMECARFPELFVKARLLDQKYQSKVVSSRTNFAVLDEEIVFVVIEGADEELHVDIFDRIQPNNEDFLGHVLIRLSNVERRTHSHHVSSRWYQLDKGDKKKAVGGRVRLRVCLEGGYHVIDESRSHLSNTLPTAEQLCTHRLQWDLQLWREPIGTVELGINGAQGLTSLKSFGPSGRGSTADAYCIAKYGSVWIRTRTVSNDLNPQWHEQHTWDVHELSTVLTVGVFDNRHSKTSVSGAKDMAVGKVRIRLSTLEDRKIYRNVYPLFMLTKSGVKKMGEVELTVRFCPTAPLLTMAKLYVTPPLPAMHYTDPIGGGREHAERLRIAAAELVVQKLLKADPPFWPEVTHFMLDTDENVFSMRRSKANLYRIKAVLGGVIWTMQRFKKVRDWEPPWITVLVHLAYAVLVYHPAPSLAFVFVTLFARGMQNFHKRAKQPAVMDAKLSQGEEMEDPDDAEEEIDEAPTAQHKTTETSVLTNPVKYYKILKGRYDRLKRIASMVQAYMGLIASYGERLQALLSWRDPRATFVFTVFCLVASVVVLLVPLTHIALLAGFYVLRHPRLRDPLPAKPVNFLTRLPDLADIML
eukprot:SM000103S09513  [mRNA]  locus=s103:385053:391694:+ [translate_table: standard]